VVEEGLVEERDLSLELREGNMEPFNCVSDYGKMRRYRELGNELHFYHPKRHAPTWEEASRQKPPQRDLDIWNTLN